MGIPAAFYLVARRGRSEQEPRWELILLAATGGGCQTVTKRHLISESKMIAVYNLCDSIA